MSNVPDTETFTLQNVYDSVHSHDATTELNLSSCVTKSISGYYDSRYSSYVGMKKFQNYTPVTTCSVPACQSFSDNYNYESATIDLYYPSGIQANDMLILVVVSDTSETFLNLSGWTGMSSITNSISSRMFFKRASGSETGYVTLTGNQSGSNKHGLIMRFNNVSTSVDPVYLSQYSASSTEYGISEEAYSLLCGETLFEFTTMTRERTISLFSDGGWVTNINYLIDSPYNETLNLVSFPATTAKFNTLMDKSWATAINTNGYTFKLKS